MDPEKRKKKPKREEFDLFDKIIKDVIKHHENDDQKKTKPREFYFVDIHSPKSADTLVSIFSKVETETHQYEPIVHPSFLLELLEIEKIPWCLDLCRMYWS